MELTKLSDKALLVKLTQRKAALTKRDNVLTATVQQQYNDNSLTVSTKLFRDKNSPINKIVAKYAEVYAYHKANTLPYVDAGPRILPSTMYFEYTQEMRQRIAVVDKLIEQWMPQYDQLVHDDVMFRNSGQAAGRACPSEYPSAEQFQAAMSNDLRFQPMPDARHFLFDLSEEDMAAFKAAEDETLQLANQETINRMLKPLHTLTKRLAEYQGTQKERFHNSLMENVIEGCKTARKLAINPPQELLNEINSIENLATTYLIGAEVIKGSANYRAEARTRLAEVAERLGTFY